MPMIRCDKCDQVFDDHDKPNTNPATKAGHSECPNPTCDPERAARLKAEKDAADAQEKKDRAAYEAWKLQQEDKKPAV